MFWHASAINGYAREASNSDIGTVSDFLFDDFSWLVRWVVVDTKNWWPGRRILVSSRSAGKIDWSNRLVNLDVDRRRIKDSPAYDPSIAIDRSYDEKLLTHYGIRLAAA